jgi:hypothetical protein
VTTEERLKNIEEKLDTVLHILGHGREKSHAEIVREVAEDIQKIRARDERREQRKKERSAMAVDGTKKGGID